VSALYGHDEAIAALVAAERSGRIHHAWLLAGPKGVGKARFADLAARYLLGRAADPSLAGFALPDEHRIAKLLAAGSHPDFARLERAWRDKTGDFAKNIAIDQVRGLQRLFATTPTYSDRRVVIVDAADDLEAPAANALLKNLEEPPAGTVFLLVAHAPARLLPTIRSRCRLLRFRPLEQGAMAAALADAMPDADAAERAAVAEAGEGAPGRALRFAGLDIAKLDAAMEAIAREGDPSNAKRAALAQSLALKAAQPRYEALLERLPSLIARIARGRQGQPLADALALWEKARTLAGSAVRLSLDPQATVFELAGLLAALAPR